MWENIDSLNQSLGSTLVWGSKSDDFAKVSIGLRSKMYDFALVFIGFRNVRKSGLAESKLRFYLSMGSKMYGFA